MRSTAFQLLPLRAHRRVLDLIMSSHSCYLYMHVLHRRRRRCYHFFYFFLCIMLKVTIPARITIFRLLENSGHLLSGIGIALIFSLSDNLLSPKKIRRGTVIV